MTTDFADRLLAVAVRALPAHRRDWGRAMVAELAALTDRAERRRFARGCVRAVAFSGPALRATTRVLVLLALSAVIVVEATRLRSVGVAVEAVGLAVAVLGLVWRDSRRDAVGPVGGRVARQWGYAVVLATVAVLLTTGVNDPSGWWLAAAAVVVYLAALLRITTRRADGIVSFPLVGALTAAGLAVWWVPMLLLAAVRAAPALTFPVAFAVVLAGAVLGPRVGSRIRGLISGLVAAGALLLLVFLAAVVTYRVAPGLAPDLFGADWGAFPKATRLEMNSVEAVDPYVADFLLGALVGAGLIIITERLVGRTGPAHPR
ncbi:hypothetical protein V5P93_003184 [Actinokineospora auranticolor]|uniref:Uncharacterized protein n=1 Tax=Actinokineospora auranticolor TaxID=155976 RepID=A0A2S6H1E6_9PSEU|nr:hypothetical protein [Actinokineospora auranticolor]PPK71318.1 hypothetical protein CLV40_101507 [Actinokineospora auranticolor]